MTNLNIRTLSNKALLIQYQEGGKAYDAAFLTWADFIEWLTGKVVATESEVQP